MYIDYCILSVFTKIVLFDKTSSTWISLQKILLSNNYASISGSASILYEVDFIQTR